MVHFKMAIRSHHFVLTNISPKAKHAIERFASRYIKMGIKKQGRRFVEFPDKVFGTSSKDRSEYRFHINQLDAFKEQLRMSGFTKDDYTVRTKKYFPVDDIEHVILPEWSDYDYQTEIIEFGCNDDHTNSKLIEIQTGKGKSYICMRIMQVLRARGVFILRPMYIDKWITDLKKTYFLENSDIVTVEGWKQLVGLVKGFKEGDLNNKIVLISNKTIQSWISMYEQHLDRIKRFNAGCRPDELMEILRSKMFIIDEAHQDFHLFYKIMCNMHSHRSLSMTATMRFDNVMLNRMAEIIYPKKGRYNKLPYHRYIRAYSVLYNVSEVRKLKTISSKTGMYNNHDYEDSVLSNKAYTRGYFELIVKLINRFYIKTYKEGDKCLVFASSISMCTAMQDFFQKAYPELKVGRYVEDDDYSHLLENDIVFSTVLSAGTNVDIPQLTFCLLSNALNSSNQNEQGWGRLRELKKDGRTPVFAYLVNEDVPKHFEYHEKKASMLKRMALYYDELKAGEIF